MAEPSRRASRLLIAGTMLASLGVGALGFLLGRSNVDPAPVSAPVVITASSTPTPSSTSVPLLPAALPLLGRAELIAAANRAVDAFASNRPLPEEITALTGRAFELRVPFACPGKRQGSAGQLSADYDEVAEALRIRVVPMRWLPEEWLPARDKTTDSGSATESLEGFWIPSPWTSSESCRLPTPASATGDAALTAVRETLGLAQIFTAASSRIGRRDGRAFQAVERAEQGTLDLTQGLRLRIRGELSRALDHGPIVCRPAAGGRPVCLLIAKLDEVAVELPGSGVTIATWDVSSQSRSEGDR